MNSEQTAYIDILTSHPDYGYEAIVANRQGRIASVYGKTMEQCGERSETIVKALNRQASKPKEESDAVAFGEYLAKQGLFCGKSPNGVYLWHEMVGRRNFTTQQLYNLFKQKNKGE